MSRRTNATLERGATLRGMGWLVLAALATATLAYQLAVPNSYLPLVALLAGIGGRWLQSQVPGWRTPNWLVAPAVLGVIAYAAFETMRVGFDVWIFAHFMILLGAIKCFERRTARDDGQILIVSIFMILAAAVESNELFPGLLTIVYLFLVAIAAMRVQIDAVGDPQPDRAGSLASVSVGAFVAILAIGAVGFFVLPREFGESFRRQGPVAQRVTDFRETVELGTGGLISQNTREVMTVRARSLEGDESVEIGGAVLRLRGKTLDLYSERRWSRRPAANFEEDRAPLSPGLGSPVDRGQLGRRDARRIELDIIQFGGATQSETAFALWRPIRFDLERAPGAPVLRVDLRDLTMRLETESGGRSGYTVRSHIPHGPPEPLQTRVRVGDGVDPVIARFAAQALEAAGIDPDPATRPTADDYAAVVALTSWLRGSKGYSLEIAPAPPDRDATAWFLESADAGHCEYFASALALMCRAVGIRSRVVTGYLLTEFDESIEAYRVRRSHAHAWVEAEVGADDWREFDATPAASLASAEGPGVNPFMRWLSGLESAWLSGFVSFDSRSQRAFQGRFADAMQRMGMNRLPLLGADGPRVTLDRWIVVVVLLGATIGGLVWFRRRRRPSVARRHAEVERAMRLLERHWRSVGADRAQGMTLRAAARTTGPEQAVELAAAIEAFSFSHHAGSTETLERLRSAADRFRAASRTPHNAP
ncbi:MAG: transglutaminase family protein [Phycisphaerales bacterium]